MMAENKIDKFIKDHELKLVADNTKICVKSAISPENAKWFRANSAKVLKALTAKK